ncbi:TPA: hypothetical protein ACSTJX_000922 [Serratia fonticola]|jgi:heme/copper-type cytochrome/quinol oxidase subunit 1
MNILKLIMSEMLMAFLIGAVPLLVVVNSNPNLGVVEHLVSLNPSDPVFIYFFCIFVLYLVTFGANRYVLKTNKTTSSLLSSAHKILYEIGFTMHNIYRVIVGAIPAAIILLVCEHGFDSEAFIVSLASSVLVLSSLVVCCFLACLNEKTAPKRKWF